MPVAIRRPRRSALLLELDLAAPLGDPPPQQPLAKALSRGQPALRDVLDGLRRAADDPRVAGLIVRVGGSSQPLAIAQELRAALIEFGRSGRPTVAWAETFGEFGEGTAGYLLATGCEQIWLQPSGEVGLTGMAIQTTFVRDLLDRAGVQVQLGARHEYKNAPNQLTERDFTPPHREALGRVVDSSLEQVLDAVGDARGLAPSEVRALVDRAPLSTAEAREAGLVDHLGYRDEAYGALRARLEAGGSKVELRFLHRLGVRPAEKARALTRRDKGYVALIDVAGGIRSGRSGRGPLGTAAGSDNVTAAVRAAIADEHAAAVVLRVDSPGGSYVASDAIWRATCALRAAGKPLVVSMGRVAASGGYFVAMAADRILAQPGTLTGSIGVFGGKVVIADLLARAGVGTDTVSAGANALLNSTRRPFDPDQLAVLEAWLDRVYADFTAKVAAARGLSAAEIDAAARGRVWTGRDALAHRLVDSLGGLHEAADTARRLAGLSPHAPLRPLPAPRPLDRLARPRSSEDPRAIGAAMSPWSPWVGGWSSSAAIAAAAGLAPAGPLTAPVSALSG